ncbi:histidine kinase [Thiococcus pfennigii]|nr:histidine kinase [Thiococcus pfennigii]
MPRATLTRRPFRLQTKLTLIFFGVTSVVAGLLSLVLFEIARDQAIADLRQRLQDVAGVAAATLDGDLHARITPEAGMDSAAYRQMQRELQRIRDNASDLYFVYTMRQAPDGSIRFVVDAEEDPAETAPLGGRYDEASPLLRSQFDRMAGPIVEEEIYTDRWGHWLSGYAPLRATDGTLVGVLGIDISAATVQAYEHRVLLIAGAVLVATLALILPLGWLIGRTIARPIAQLNEGALRIAEGDLDVRLALARRDEIGTLGESFDRMAANLAASRREIEAVAAKYQAIFDNASEGIFQTTPAGEVVSANQALLGLLGFHELAQMQAEIEDLGAQVYVDPRDRETMLAELRARGRVDGFETQLRRRDGTSFWAELALHRTTDRDGRPILEGMLLDATDRHRRQQAERESATARAANEAKSSFLANMSHEIRTPMNAIMGLTDLLLRTDLDERQRDYLTKIKTSSASLLAVINDILDLSKIESGRLELEDTPFSLEEVMANLTEMLAYRAHERDIELIVSIDPQVPRALVGDPVRLGQILLNLTSNAIKFTAHGEVVVSVALEEAPTACGDDRIMVRFQVQDTGTGIPEDRLDAIFEPFTQADDSITRHHGGTGLGLPISRQLAEQMGGELRVESRPGAGSTFTARVLLRRQTERGAVQPVTPRDLRGLAVLIVDDNATAREILVSQIESFQMEATAAASGEEALAILADPTRTFDLVLLDWKMPGLNGLETARRIRTDLDLARVPLVCMVSAYAREDLMQRAERTLLDAFLHKPINQSFLFDTILGLFGHQMTGAAAQAASAPEARPELTGRRILLVEDIDLNRLVATEWLASLGLSVDIAENGAEALARVDPTRHDAVLMDIQMPVMDGLEATRQMRATPGLETLPIIAMTAHALKGDLERCLAAGMNDYVPKPIDPARLFAALGRWIAPADQAPTDTATTGSAAPGPGPGATAGVPDAERLAGLRLPGIDVNDGLARANRNTALYLKMLRGFQRTWADVVERVEAHLAQGQIEEARRAVHSIKGIAGNLGATRLYERAAAAEHLIGDGAWRPDASAWRDFATALAEVQRGLADLPADEAPEAPTTPAGTAAPTKAELRESLARLIEQLDDDLDAARTALQALRPPLAAHLGSAPLRALIAQIDDFDIDAAIATLKAMLEELARHD